MSYKTAISYFTHTSFSFACYRSRIRGKNPNSHVLVSA